MISSIRSIKLWLALTILVSAPANLLAASSVCDPSITHPHDHEQGYHDRGGQICEGTYGTGVSSMGLMLASFTGPMQGINLARKTELTFHWDTVTQSEIRIKADSLRPKFFYRMDAVRPSSESQLNWTNAIPAYHELRTSEFGILATQTDDSGNQIYLPLRIGKDGQDPVKGNYVVTVISGVEIKEVYWTLCIPGEETCLAWDEALDRRPYAANQSIAIELDRLVTAGRYLLTISAKLRNGSFDSVNVPFHYSP